MITQQKTEVSFSATSEELSVIKSIGKRAVTMAKELDIKYGELDAQMDVLATHANGNPLRLVELLAADDFNFAHDVFGIRANLDRSNGKLKNFFVPRFSR